VFSCEEIFVSVDLFGFKDHGFSANRAVFTIFTHAYFLLCFLHSWQVLLKSVIFVPISIRFKIRHELGLVSSCLPLTPHTDSNPHGQVPEPSFVQNRKLFGSLLIILGLLLEFLTVDSAFAEKPIAKLVVLAAISSFDCGVA